MRERMLALRLKEKLDADGSYAARIGVEVLMVDGAGAPRESETDGNQ